MKLLDFIKKLFGKQPKMLEERTPTNKYENPIQEENTLRVEDDIIIPQENTREKMRKKFLEKDLYAPKIVSKGLDFAINQYLSALEYQMQTNQEINSYKALTELGALDNRESGNNLENQNLLIDQIENDERLVLMRQPVDVNKPASFFHVSTKGCTEPENGIRLYINVKRENIAQLSTELINELEGEDFYFKFISDQNIAKNSRQEAIVIYTDEVKSQSILQALERIKNRNAQLFEGSKQGNPFMKRTLDETVCFVPDITENEYIEENGSKLEIAPSYNSLLSSALYDSFINSMIRESSREPSLRTKLANSKYIEEYIGIYTQMDDRQKYELAQEMKKSLKMAQIRNPKLDIIEMDTINIQDKNNNYKGQLR